ncbi:uncharacterized protein LOC125234358 [Leguminivora glycinivorella]|uniref:uncharacterized protein LOC125234358 n=1 Tax=Leguminivora glycinivorella TaxID=1035111 RepID=UPI00200D1318|nr:uncharacterized protein LOC125234358 [Leguminivora glycinivorella]
MRCFLILLFTLLFHYGNACNRAQLESGFEEVRLSFIDIEADVAALLKTMEFHAKTEKKVDECMRKLNQNRNRLRKLASKTCKVKKLSQLSLKRNRYPVLY